MILSSHGIAFSWTKTGFGSSFNQLKDKVFNYVILVYMDHTAGACVYVRV